MPRKSRRLEIRQEIALQRQNGEIPTVRSVRAVVGGSNSTILEELGGRADSPRTTSKPSANAKPGANIDQAALNEMICQAISEGMAKIITELTADISSELRKSTAYSMQKIEYAYARFMEMADTLKHTTGQLLLTPTAAPQQQAPQKDADQDMARANAKIQVLINSNAELAIKVQNLVSLCTDNGIEVDLQRIGSKSASAQGG